jgi:hypothetical protein
MNTRQEEIGGKDVDSLTRSTYIAAARILSVAKELLAWMESYKRGKIINYLPDSPSRITSIGC